MRFTSKWYTDKDQTTTRGTTCPTLYDECECECEGAGDGAYSLSSLSEKTRISNHLQVSLQRQHILLSYPECWIGLGLEPMQAFLAPLAISAQKVKVRLMTWSIRPSSCSTEKILLDYGILLYVSVSTRAVIGQFSGPYSTVRPAKFTMQNVRDIINILLTSFSRCVL